MKNYIMISLLSVFFVTTSCVQKTTHQKVVFNLDVKGIKNIKKVGLRGEKPLGWNFDTEMKLGKDSIYSATIDFETGYKFVQYKFTINEEFELKDKENRRAYFNSKGITTVLEKFEIVK